VEAHTATPRLRPSARQWRLLALALIGSLAGWHGYDVATPGLSDRSGRLKAPDFLQFYTYGSLMAENQVDRLYEADAHAAVARRVVDPRLVLTSFSPNYSPVIAFLAVPLTGLSFAAAMVAFSAFSAWIYGLSVWLLTSITTRVKSDVVTTVLLAAAWPALTITLRYGQISALSLFVVTAATVSAASGRQWLAGAALGLLVYKPNLLLGPVLILVVARQWRLVGGLALGAGLELAANLAIAGPDVMCQYVTALLKLAANPERVQFYPAESHSLRGLVQLLVPWPSLVTAATVVALPLAAWLGVRAWRAHHDFRPRWAALVVASLVASPHVLTYDLLLLAVPLVLLVDWSLETRPGLPSAPFLWSLALLYFGAWPGPFIARLYHVQVSTVGMLWLLWLLAEAPRADRA
jgi:alpha-1,2-mannosyltransferase